MAAAESRICFLINPAAGHGKVARELPHIERLMQSSGQSYRILKTTGQGSATEISLSAINEGYDVIVACGGDGTVSEVATALNGRNIALGIIPRGSGNGLARHHRIPFDLEKSIRVILNGRRVMHDAIKINDRLSVNVSGIGFDAHVASLFGKDGKRGFSGYAKLTVSEYFRYRDQPVKIISDEDSVQTKAFLIAIANSTQFGNNAYIAPLADTNDGLTDITVVRKMPLYAMPGFVLRVFNRSVYQSAYATRFCNNSFRIECEDPLPLHIDGEPAGRNTLFHISTIKNAFALIVP